MSKAVVVPYVIALVFGIMVIGVIGYWFVNQGGKTISTGSKTECDAVAFSYCYGHRSWDNKCGIGLPDCNKLFGIPNPSMASPQIRSIASAGQPPSL